MQKQQFIVSNNCYEIDWLPAFNKKEKNLENVF
jgi:hypothetical protein